MTTQMKKDKIRSQIIIFFLFVFLLVGSAGLEPATNKL